MEVEYYSASSDQNYQRLAKAYVLDKDAAVMACSWGKFQILGENYKGCGYRTLASFLADQVESEKGQLHAFVEFIKMMKLQTAMNNKDWAEFARRYNGQNYKKYKYDQKIKKAYELLCND